ncbi:MAG TPA: ATP-binding protein [Puia sp.]
MRLFSFAVIVGILIVSFAVVPARGQSGYTIYHYTNENGLPANGIKGMELDRSSGFLWVGTQGGLVRFDGRQFKKIISDTSAMAASRITVVCRNREGTIYCVDDNFAVYRIEGNHAVYAGIDSILMSNYSSGAFHVKSPRELAQILKKLARSSFLYPAAIYREESAPDSNFSFLYQEDGYYYSAVKDTLVHLPGVHGIMKMNGEAFFIRGNADLWRYDDSAGLFTSVRLKGMPSYSTKGEQKPRFIWTPGMQAPVLVYKRDLWELGGSGKELYLTPLCRACSPENGAIVCVQIWEKLGMIFLGSATNGLYILKRPFLRTVRKDSTPETEKAEYAQAEITPGAVTTSTGFSFSSKGERIAARPEMTFPGSNIYQDGKGDSWFFSRDTIKHYYRRDHRLVKIRVDDGAEKMVFAETRGRIFMVSEKTIADITGDRYRPLYTLARSSRTLKNALSPDAAVELAPGVLAIAGEKLILFNTEKPEKIDTVVIPGLTVKVRALFKYGHYLLIGTYGQGFYMYRNGIVKKMPLDKNRYLSAAHCFLPDDKGFFWISTNHGLFKASQEALTAAFERNLPEIYYQYFGKDDGIFNTEFNGGCQPCGIKLTSGLYSFPTMNGMVLFDPLQSPDPPPPGRIFIDRIETDSVSREVTDSALSGLPDGMRNIRFQLSLPEFGNRENIYFSYKLEHYSDDWEVQDITQNSTLQFGGLKPGKYNLRLRVRNGFGPDQFGMTEVSFRILEPWYHMWWFYVLCLLVSVLFVWLLVKWRTVTITRRREALQRLVDVQTRDIEAQSRQLEQQLHRLQSQQARLEENNRIKARLIGIISHDMMSPLKFLSFMSKNLRDGHALIPAAQEKANFIVTVAQELESLSLNMLNWIKFHYGSPEMKAEAFDLCQLVVEWTEIPSTLAREKGLTFYNEVPTRLEVVQYRQALGVIVYNLAMNAMKYTSAGEVRIVVRLDQDHIFLAVIDTGPGMGPTTVERLNQAEPIVSIENAPATKTQFGYIIINDLLRLMSGTMKVESAPKQGTRVTVIFPIRL